MLKDRKFLVKTSDFDGVVSWSNLSNPNGEWQGFHDFELHCIDTLKVNGKVDLSNNHVQVLITRVN